MRQYKTSAADIFNRRIIQMLIVRQKVKSNNYEFPGRNARQTLTVWRHSCTPDKEEANANRIAFFSQFYLGQQAILENPDIKYNYDSTDHTLFVTVSFKNDIPEVVTLHYAYDRFTAGSKGYEYDVWEQQSIKKKDKYIWQLKISVPEKVKSVNLLSFQEGNKEMPTNSLSNYITVEIK